MGGIIIISVIVPCYNSENSIGKCIDSILKQTYTSFEIIIVDDGSVDNTKREILRVKDERIIYIYQENKGVSSARNLGIKNAKGEFLAFVDSDDSINENMFAELIIAINKSNYDMAICQIGNESGELIDDIISSDHLVECFQYKSIGGYLWNKLFKLSIIKNNHLLLDENIHFMEDLLFCIRYGLSCQENAIFINKPLYNYQPSLQSVTLKKYSQKKLTGIDALEKVLNLLDDEDEEYNLYYSYYYHFMLSLLVNGMNEKEISHRKILEIKNKIKKCEIKRISNKKISWSVIISRFSVSVYYMIWKIIQKDYKYDKKIH